MSLRENFNFTSLENWLNEKRVTEVECLVPDLTGVARGKILPRAKFTQDRGMRIPEAVLAMTVTGEYPEDDADYDEIVSIVDQDMHLRADPGTVRIVPWATDPTAQVIHDCILLTGSLWISRLDRSCAESWICMRLRDGLQSLRRSWSFIWFRRTPTPIYR